MNTLILIAVGVVVLVLLMAVLFRRRTGIARVEYHRAEIRVRTNRTPESAWIRLFSRKSNTPADDWARAPKLLDEPESGLSPEAPPPSSDRSTGPGDCPSIQAPPPPTDVASPQQDDTAGLPPPSSARPMSRPAAPPPPPAKHTPASARSDTAGLAPAPPRPASVPPAPQGPSGRDLLNVLLPDALPEESPTPTRTTIISYCANCGSANSDRVAYCRRCGFEIGRGSRGSSPAGGVQAPSSHAPAAESPKRSHSSSDPEPEPVYLGASAPQSVRPGDHFTARFVAYIEELKQ